MTSPSRRSTETSAGPGEKVESEPPRRPDPKYLWEEYKLLQDKLDKIGAFRFQVKSWLVATVTAFVVSGYAAHIPSFAYLFGLLLMGGFWAFERFQEELHKGFVRRILALERTLSAIDDPVFFTRRQRSVRYARIKKLSAIPPSSPADAVYLVDLELRRQGFRGRVIRHADSVFYFLLGVLVIAAGSWSYFAATRPQGSQRIDVVSPVRVELFDEPKQKKGSSKP